MGRLTEISELDIDLSFPCINALKEKITWMKQRVAYMKEVMVVGRKVLTGLSLVLMVCMDIRFFISSTLISNANLKLAIHLSGRVRPILGKFDFRSNI